MKLAVLVVTALLLTGSAIAEEPKNQKPAKFEMTVTVKYNSLTLEEAARREKAIRKMLGDEACSIGVAMSSGGSGLLTFSSPDVILP